MNRYDVIVLGGGSAGTRAARVASEAGARTAMINDGELGGLCILRGCMPTKAMLASAHAMHAASHLSPFGITAGSPPTAQFDQIMNRQKQMVERFQRAKIQSIESSGYDVINGRGHFIGPHELQVGEQQFTAKAFVIATGSSPFVPMIPGIENVRIMTSDDVMDLTVQPKSLITYGSGPIGLELAQFFARIGTKVHLVARSPLLHAYDLEAGQTLKEAMSSELDFYSGRTIQAFEGDKQRARAILSDGTILEAEGVLMAVGRTPNLDRLNLAALNLTAETFRASIQPTMQTEQPHVYAAGDVTGQYQILHISNAEGSVAGANAAGANPQHEVDYRLLMSVVFTDPPYALLGSTEIQLKATLKPYKMGVAQFAETGRAITMSVQEGHWKLLGDPETDLILGCSILGPRADDLIHLMMLAMAQAVPIHELPNLPWYHPTLSEVILDVVRSYHQSKIY